MPKIQAFFKPFFKKITLVFFILFLTAGTTRRPDFEEAEIKLVAQSLPKGCSLEEAREALNCAINSPTVKDIIYQHIPPPLTDVMAPEARDWRVKVAFRLLLLRRLMSLQLSTDLEVCWSALEKANWSVEEAANILIYG